MPALDEVRAAVEREVLSAQRRRRIDELYATMLSRYKVVVEQRRSEDRGGVRALPLFLPGWTPFSGGRMFGAPL